MALSAARPSATSALRENSDFLSGPPMTSSLVVTLERPSWRDLQTWELLRAGHSSPRAEGLATLRKVSIRKDRLPIRMASLLSGLLLCNGFLLAPHLSGMTSAV